MLYSFVNSQLRLPISESAEDVYSGVSTSETDTLSESMACKISTTVGGNQLDTSHSGQAFLYRLVMQKLMANSII